MSFHSTAVHQRQRYRVPGILLPSRRTAATYKRYSPLNDPKKALLPAVAAVGGVITPALIFLLFNAGTPFAGGWAVPTATDIAFALGLLAIFGKGLPRQVRIFLLTLAVDDV